MLSPCIALQRPAHQHYVTLHRFTATSTSTLCLNHDTHRTAYIYTAKGVAVSCLPANIVLVVVTPHSGVLRHTNLMCHLQMYAIFHRLKLVNDEASSIDDLFTEPMDTSAAPFPLTPSPAGSCLQEVQSSFRNAHAQELTRIS